MGVLLTEYHSFQLRVQAAALLLPASESEVPEMAEAARFFIGEGTNILPLGDLPAVLSTRHLRGYEVVTRTRDAVEVEVAAGEGWDAFVRFSLTQGWYGLENLAAIPGNVGGAAVQNIGAYGVELAPYVVSVYGWDRLERRWKRISGEACGYGYRQSIFQRAEWQDRFLITRVRIRLWRRFRPILTYPDLERLFGDRPVNDPWQVYQAVRSIRLRKLPPKGSAGSFFKNPTLSEEEAKSLRQKATDVPLWKLASGQYKVPAAWLIEKAGLKGFEMGKARISPQHALVLENTGDASPEEIAKLAQHIQKVVEMRWGIRLVPEVRYLSP